MNLGNKYRKARLKAGLSLHEVSIYTQPRVSVTQLSLFERDLITLQSDKIEAICRVINFSDHGDSKAGKQFDLNRGWQLT